MTCTEKSVLSKTYSNTTQCQNIRLPGVRHKRDLDYESISGTNLLQSEAFFSLCAVSLIFLNYTLYYRFCLCQNLRQKVPLAGAMAVVVDVQVKVAVSAQKAHGNLLEIVHLVILDVGFQHYQCHAYYFYTYRLLIASEDQER